MALPAFAADPPLYGDYDSQVPGIFSDAISPSWHPPEDPPDIALIAPSPIKLTYISGGLRNAFGWKLPENDGVELTEYSFACPGSIIHVQASGGIDWDLLKNGTEPLWPGNDLDVGCHSGAYPPGGCPECECYQVVWNWYRPYAWYGYGYITTVEYDDASPQRKDGYFEVDYRLESQGANTSGSLIVLRKEAQPEIEAGPLGIGILRTINYIDPPQFVLTHGRHPNVGSDLTSQAIEGSENLRQDLNNLSPSTLKNAYLDKSDVHVCIDYSIGPAFTSNNIPPSLNSIPSDDEYNLLLFQSMPYTVFSVENIEAEVDPPVPPGFEISGLKINGPNGKLMLFIRSHTTRTLMHEIGHGCNLPDLYETQDSINLMYYTSSGGGNFINAGQAPCLLNGPIMNWYDSSNYHHPCFP